MLLQKGAIKSVGLTDGHAGPACPSVNPADLIALVTKKNLKVLGW